MFGKDTKHSKNLRGSSQPKGILIHRENHAISIPQNDIEYATTVALPKHKDNYKTHKTKQLKITQKAPTSQSEDSSTISFQFEEADSQLLQSTRSKEKTRNIQLPDIHNMIVLQNGIRVEKVSLCCRLLIVILCVSITAMMSKLTSEWSLERRRCPMYVPNIPNIDIYWGNEKMFGCNYPAYMPVVIVITSLAVILLNSGIVTSRKQSNGTSRLLYSTNYPLVMLYLLLAETAVAISIACVLIDGFRVTCLTFQLNPWPDERPPGCKEGYNDRDDAYGLHNSFAKIMASIVLSWITVALLVFCSFLYLRRCKCCRHS